MQNATYYIMTFSPFVDKWHNGLHSKGADMVSGPIFSAERAEWALTRFRGAGAIDAELHPLTREEYRAYVLARHPQLKV